MTNLKGLWSWTRGMFFPSFLSFFVCFFLLFLALVLSLTPFITRIGELTPANQLKANNRMFYLALPPSVFVPVSTEIKVVTFFKIFNDLRSLTSW